MQRLQADVDCLWAARAVLGEGPIFDGRARRVLWLDIKGRRLLACEHDGQNQKTWPLASRLCSIDVPPDTWPLPGDLDGDIYFGAGDHGFGWIAVGANGVRIVPILHPEANRPGNRFNDGKLGPDGRYWAGTMDDAEQLETGRLYAFDRDGGCSVMDDGYRVPNGPAFSPDGRVVYHTDSARQLIFAFDLDRDGRTAQKRVLCRFTEGEGYPDGMTTDALGNLYVAVWDGRRVEKISPDGTRLGFIDIPTARPTSCVFSSIDPRVLYVTSAAIGASSNDSLAGSLFRVTLG